jgi:hypothetical protein
MEAQVAPQKSMSIYKKVKAFVMILTRLLTHLTVKQPSMKWFLIPSLGAVKRAILLDSQAVTYTMIVETSITTPT